MKKQHQAPASIHTITEGSINHLKSDLVTQQPLIDKALSYLRAMGIKSPEDLSPEDLIQIGQKLCDPKALLGGQNILKAQNLKRQHHII